MANNKFTNKQFHQDYSSSDEEINPINVVTEEADYLSSDESWSAGACGYSKVNDSPLSHKSDGFSSDDTWDGRQFKAFSSPKIHEKEKVSVKDKVSKSAKVTDLTSDDSTMSPKSAGFSSDDTWDGMDFKTSQNSSPKIHEKEKVFAKDKVNKSSKVTDITSDDLPLSHKNAGFSSDDTWDGRDFKASQNSSPKIHEKEKVFAKDKVNKSAKVTNLTSDDSPLSRKSAVFSSDDTWDGRDFKASQNSSPKIHKKEKVFANDKVKRSAEVIDLTSNEEIDLDKIIENEVKNREVSLKAEKQRLELEERDTIFQLNNLESAIKSMELDKLPDKGARMKHLMDKKKKELKSIAERQSFVDKQLKTVQNEQKTVPYINELPTASMKLSELGQKALETHNIERALTVDTLEKIHKSVENQPKSFNVEPKPGLTVTLLPHQKYGLGWALWRETQKPSGGILADDMGLGKTLTMISLILHTLEDKKDEKSDNSSDEESSTHRRSLKKGGTLVITPASVMGQWSNEVKCKVQFGKLSCHQYHGASRKKKSGIHTYDIVLSTYNTVLNECEDDPLMKVRWKRIVLDEAHIIRNSKSKTAISIFKLKGGKRWALTGTPVQNKELDMYAILRFLRCKPFDDLRIWKRWIDNKDAAGIQRLNCILKATLLRRTKEDLKAEGSLNILKAKIFHQMSVSLNEEEYSVYKKVAYFSKTLLGQLIHQKAEKECLLDGGMGSVRSRHNQGLSEENPFIDHPELRELYRDMMSLGNVKTHHILVLLLRLRQICCHPALAVSVLETDDLKTDGIESNQPGDVEMIGRLRRLSITSPQETASNNIFQRSTWSSKLRAVIDCIMDILEKTDDKIIVVSQWRSVLEILKDYLLGKKVKSVEFTGSISVKERPAILKEFNENIGGHRVMLLSLLAGGTGLNLIGANHLILIDCHWNPQLEAQACDRIYRVGQPKEVHIYKFICSSTIEERIVELQKKKLELSEGVLKGTINSKASNLTLSDLKALFQVK